MLITPSSQPPSPERKSATLVGLAFAGCRPSPCRSVRRAGRASSTTRSRRRGAWCARRGRGPAPRRAGRGSGAASASRRAHGASIAAAAADARERRAHRANNSFMPPAISTDTSTSTRGSAMPPGRYQVARLPHRIELRLVAAQTLEVIEVLAVAEDEVADAVPGGGERMGLETRQRRHAEVEPAVALRASPQHQLDEQVVHGAARRLPGSKRIRSTDSSSRVPVVHRLAKATGVPRCVTTATGNWRRYSGEKAPTEKRFSPVDLSASQASEMRCSSGMSWSRRSGATTSNCAPSRCARRCAWRRSARAAALEREIGQRHARFLADLQRREPQVHVQRQPLAAHLVEDGLAAVVVGHLAQAPHQLLRALLRADRIAECDPAAPGDLVHDEGIAGVAEQQPLVAGERRVGERVVGYGDERRAPAPAPPGRRRPARGAPGAACSAGRRRCRVRSRPARRAACAARCRAARTSTTAGPSSRRGGRTSRRSTPPSRSRPRCWPPRPA